MNLKADQKAQLPEISTYFKASYNRYKWFFQKLLFFIKKKCSLIEKLNDIRKELRQEALNLSSASFDLNKVMKPRQIANLLLAVEQVELNLLILLIFFVFLR